MLMFKKVSNTLHREGDSSYKAAVLMGGFALFSQLLLVFRNRLLVGHFGAGQVLDIYFAASRIPDLLFVCAASTMAAGIFVPALAKYASESERRAYKFVDDTFSVLFIAMFLLTVAAMLFAPWITRVLYPAFDLAGQAEIVLVTRVLLAVPLFFALTNLLGSITQLLNKSIAFLLAPALYNAGIVLGAILFYPAFGVVGLALGAVSGAFLAFFVHFFICSRNGFSLMFNWRPSYLDIWQLVKSAFPQTLYFVISQLSLLVLFAFAAKMDRGAVTIFSLAFTLQAMFLVVFGVPFVAAVFSDASTNDSGEVPSKFIDRFLLTARRIFFSLSVVSVFVFVLRAQVVRVALGASAYGWHATRLTIAALAIFSLSILAQGLNLLIVRAFNVVRDKLILLIVATISGLFIVILAHVLNVEYAHSIYFKNFIEALFRVEGVPGTRMLMLPIAYTTGTLISSILLFYFFSKSFGSTFLQNIRVSIGQAFFASLFAGFISYEFLVVLGLWLNLHTFVGIFLQGIGALAAGSLAWFFTLELLENTESKELLHVFMRKFKNTDIILSGPEEV